MAIETDASGTWDVSGGVRVLVSESAAYAAQESGLRADIAAELVSSATKRTAAMSAIQAEKNRINAIAPASRTTTERAFLGLVYLLAKAE